MALHSLRLRRTLSVLSAFHRYAAVSSQTRHSIFCPSAPSLSKSPAMISPHWPLRSSSIASYSQSSLARKKEPDEIILEGCDYKHWLITMDFKDSKPTPEEMVRTYEETCAKGLNISVEEAKQKMYACSTTLYHGFQAVMTEEESEKFRDLPGVEFILPDAYIDPEKKEYGGDKYINGTIVPRPPPTQYGGRQEPIDRNGNPDQPRYERPTRSETNSQGNSSFNQRDSKRGDGHHFRASQNYLPQRPPKNYNPLRPGERRDHSPMNTSAPEGRNSYQGGRGPMPSHQENYQERGEGSYNHVVQGNYQPQGEQRDFVPLPGPGNFGSGFTPRLGERRDHSLVNTYVYERRDSYQGGKGLMPSHRGNYNQRGQGSYNHDLQENYQPRGEQRDYVFPLVQGNFDSGFSPRLGERRDHSPMNIYATRGRDSYQGGRGLMPSHRGNYNLKGQRSYNHDLQESHQFQGEQRDYVFPLVQGNFDSGFTPRLRERRDHSPMNTYAPEGRDSYHGGRGLMPSHQGNYNRRGQESYNHDLQGSYQPQGEQRDYVFPLVQGNFDSSFTPRLGERRDHSPVNTYASEGRDSYQGGRGLMPSHRGNYNQREQESYNHDVQENYQLQGEQRDYVFPLVQGNFDSGFTPRLGERRDHSPMNTYAFEGRDSYQGGRGLMPSHQGNYNQRGQESYNHDVQENYQPEGEQRDYVPPLVQGNFDSDFTPRLGERRDRSPLNIYAYEGRDSYRGGKSLMPSHQGNYNQRGQGSYNHDVQENYQPQGEQRDYVFPLGQGNSDGGFTPRLGERRDHSPMNTYAPVGRGLMPSHRGNYNEQGSYNHDVQGNYWPQGEQRDYTPPLGQVNFGGGFSPWLGEMKDHLSVINYAPEGRDSYQGGRGPMPFHQGNYNQREQGSYNHDVQEIYQPEREQRVRVPPPGQGNYGSGFNPTQGGPYVLGGYCSHGAGTPYGQGQSHGSYPNFTEGERFSLGDQRNVREEQLNYNQRVQVSYNMPPLGQGIFGSGFTSGLEERRDHSLMNTYAPVGRDSYQGGRCSMPSHHVNYHQRWHGSYNHVQGNYWPQGEDRDYMSPPSQGNFGSGFNLSRG
ncbi:multiple organellar RNA editing factor 4 [Cucumis melo var. makuwa]|uniref:Multiple organellar RNA editing factor 4 n=1 Tax=Cucumis melo var. makuwa TaxID=1194695 RepID=A0A5A7SUN6_CUCMM|nr:multiple organellar RNA editing factor 4 [Cucumis melo var. makuwa]